MEGQKGIGLMQKGNSMLNFISESSQLAPSKQRVKSFELFHRVKLPQVFVDVICKFNGAKCKDSTFNIDGEERVVERLLCILDDASQDLVYGQYEISVVVAQIEERLTDDEDQVGTTILPFAVLFGGDLLCLDYRIDVEHPSVVIWDHDESDELYPVTFPVAESLTKFIDI